MPEICRFFGIVIFMYFDEHEPPHFHVRMPSIERWCSLIQESSAVGSLTEFAHWCLSGAGCISKI